MSYGPAPKPLSERFWPKVAVRAPDECWEWTAGLDNKGYGSIRGGTFSRHHIGAHRAAWLLTKGQIPNGLFVCHKCDNPKCVNPQHLFLGDVKDNGRDMSAKRRGCGQRATRCVRGHEFTPENTRRPGGHPYRRVCRECARLHARKKRVRAAQALHRLDHQ